MSLGLAGGPTSSHVSVDVSLLTQPKQKHNTAATAPPTATALPGDLRQRIAECLGRLVGQSRYFAASFPAHAGALAGTQLAAAERTLLGELTGHLMEAQRVVFAWLDQEVYPLFLRSWLCGVLSGDVQARRSHPLRRKRRLRTLFKSVRPFRHVYVPPCPRSEGRGLVLVCTEGVTPPPPPLGQELVWAFDVAVFPARRPAPMTAAELVRCGDFVDFWGVVVVGVVQYSSGF